MIGCRVDSANHERCATHGGLIHPSGSFCQTYSVLLDVAQERQQQFARYGTNANLENGTGPHVNWLAPLAEAADAALVERGFRQDYDEQHAVTWMHLVREEVAEAFCENDPVRLREELVQVAALCVSWMEKLDQRAAQVVEPAQLCEQCHCPITGHTVTGCQACICNAVYM